MLIGMIVAPVPVFFLFVAAELAVVPMRISVSLYGPSLP